MSYFYITDTEDPELRSRCDCCHSMAPLKRVENNWLRPTKTKEYWFLCELCDKSNVSHYVSRAKKEKGMRPEIERMAALAVVVCQVGNLVIDQVTGRKPE